MSLPEALNADYIEAQYTAWKADPASVSSDWRAFFQGFEIARSGGPAPSADDGDESQALKQARVEALIYSYRDIGHLLACMDPLMECPIEHPLLSLEAFDLTLEDLERQFFTRRFASTGYSALKDIVQALKETYCRSVGVEYMHLQDPAERHWLQARMEPQRNRPTLTSEERVQILHQLLQSAIFEQYLNKKFIGVTRFSLEGGDALIPMLKGLTEHAVSHGCREIILGMAHRGRLNVQTHLFQKPYEDIFGEFENCYDPDSLVGSGDVKYHNGYLTDIQIADKPLRLYLVNNPSHLEAVNPVVEGFVRARQDMTPTNAFSEVMPLLIHGDAAFAGQGIVAETLNMSQLAGYKTGGTLHIIINNQIGYTTLPHDARSTRYSTDIAKMLMVPIFHVHGENPEAVVHIARLATEYRMTFNKDVVIDLICYRRYGHNEGDEPYFTQPQMYERIRQRPSLDQLYRETLQAEGIISAERVDQMAQQIEQTIDAAYNEIHGSACTFPEPRFFDIWDGYSASYSHDPLPTGVAEKQLLDLAHKLNQAPADFAVHSKLQTLFKKRLKAVVEGQGIDWANAEALAFASLLTENTPIRLSGQDCARGTFSQRHSVLNDTQTGAQYTPLNHLADQQATYQVHNSLLAEASVLGFEYGYALAQPQALTLWEAQFGDFVNNAQAIFDLFIASGQSKWQRLNGLVMLLPHGWEGLGPEHSSARLERFLQLCAHDNIQVCNLSTPAQYFHLLRRQIKSPYRKPLIIMTPKSLLRHPQAVSSLKDLATGHFSEVLDEVKPAKSIRRVLFCSGKIYYELLQRRKALKKRNTAIVRLEQFYPFPEVQLSTIARKFRQAKHWFWVQEEPSNMGAWTFIKPRLEALIGQALNYIGRPEASSPATGFPAIYQQQQRAISDEAVGPLPASTT